MKIEFLNKTMKKVMKYLPFTLLFISTIILTVLAFILLPFILAYKKLDSLLSKRAVTDIQFYEDQQVYSGHSKAYYIRVPEE